VIGRLPGFRSRRRGPKPAGACPQCGRPGADLLSLTARRTRWSCRSCGAVITTVRTARPGTPAPADRTPDPLEVFMPAAMAAWLRERFADEELTASPDRATLSRWYTEFDGHAGRPAEARPPRFAKVFGAVNSSCFDVELAVGRLLAPDPVPGQAEATRERVRHVLAWIAGPGRASSWLADAKVPVDPDPEEVAALLAMDDLSQGPRQGYGGALRSALFGVGKGPSAQDILARFGEERVRAALRTYLEEGARPLSAELRAHLDGHAARAR
jgi:hypothetical protein